MLIFQAELTGTMRDILFYSESSMGPPWLGQEKSFQNVGSQKPGKRHFMIGVQVLRSPQLFKNYLILAMK